MSLTISIEDGATPALKRYMAALRDRRPMMEAAGGALEVVLHEHFLRRDARGNAKRWPRKHFWNRVVKNATSFTGATANEATVTIASREFAQKLYGGVIKPTTGKYLAIPLTARAYEAGRPMLWKGAPLRFVRLDGGKLLMVEKLHAPKGWKRNLDRRIKNKQPGRLEGGEAQYLLLRSVRQAADAEALPSESKMGAGVRMAVKDWLGRRLAA